MNKFSTHLNKLVCSTFSNGFERNGTDKSENLTEVKRKNFSTLEIIFCAFLAENNFVKVLIPLKGVLKRVQLVWARSDLSRDGYEVLLRYRHKFR